VAKGNILVTGGAGYIGSHACVALLEVGFHIVVVDNFSNSSEEALHRVMAITGKRFPYYRLDLRDREGLQAVFRKHPFDAVIHFAGLKAVGESCREPLRYYDNNVSGTVALCEVMETFRVKRMVFSSSATVYGEAAEMPVTEETPPNPQNPYGRTKLFIEEILKDCVRADRLKGVRPTWSVVLLRYFNPVGAHESGQLGEDPLGVPNNLMPYICQVAVGRLKALQIFGNDYPTPDGTGVRDYIHVMDLVEAHVRALEKLLTGEESGVQIYNLGTGRGYSVLEVVRTFERVNRVEIPFRFVKRRPGDVAVIYADPSKAERELGWKAKRGLEEMVRDAYRWQVKNPQGYRPEA